MGKTQFQLGKTAAASIAAVLLILVMVSGVSAATGAVKIQDNSTGGDCTSVGVWNQYTKTCTLTTDITFSSGNGIEIVSNGVTLDGGGHVITGSGGFATGGSLSVKNDVTIRNLTVRNFGYGIYLLASHGNTITGNTIENNDVGLKLVSSNNNVVYGNSFIDNNTQATAQGGTGNVFNLPAPAGGNYWSDWASPDADNDGFVDNPYTFTGGTDNLPLAGASSCNAGKPALQLRVSGAYWASAADYGYGRLSVEYALDNAGAETAFDATITGSSGSNGVLIDPQQQLPVNLGDITAAGTAGFTIKYMVPPGVAAFRADIEALAVDECGNNYSYP